MNEPARPLEGLRVAVTRPRDQAAELSGALRDSGADTLEYPAIRLVAPDDPGPLRAAARELPTFDWVVFTSANGVERFARALADAGVAPSVARHTACVGPGTAAAARQAGFPEGLTAARHLSEGLVETLKVAGSLAGRRVLLPRSQAGRDTLPDALRALGAQVSDVAAYRPEPDAESLAELGRRVAAGDVDVVTLTASSAASAYASAIGTGGVTFACIGPITATTAREEGLAPLVAAEDHTVPGLVTAIARWRAGAPR